MRTTSLVTSLGGVAAALVLILAPALVQASAGRVDFAIGDVVGVDASGKERRITKGAVINSGDTIKTRRGRAQIRFNDGAYTSLLPATEFRVDEYEFKEQESETSRGFFSLLKGGLRTITGAIGRARKKSYRLSTPVATIGIRGTQYLAVLGNSLTISVAPGTGSVLSVFAGGVTREITTTAYVADANSAAVETDTKPEAPPPQKDVDLDPPVEECGIGDCPVDPPEIRDGLLGGLRTST